MIRVGILGTGSMGSVHARQYARMPDVDLFVHDRKPDRAEAFSKTFRAQSMDSVEALLRQVDIVDVCLPTDLHAEFGHRAIAEGRAVIMEKPMARDLDECVALIEAAERANVPFGVAQVVRYFPEFAAGHRVVQRGDIGRPAAARTRRGGRPPLRGSENWFMDHRRSGGVLLDLAIHDFDWLRWTFGEVAQLYARSVQAKRDEGGPDYALTTLTFDSGLVAHVEATWMDPSGFRTSYEVCGSEGMIEYDSRNAPTLRLHQDKVSVTENVIDPGDDPYYLQLRAFVDAVQAGEPVPVDGKEGAMAVAIARAAMESAREDRTVTPPRL